MKILKVYIPVVVSLLFTVATLAPHTVVAQAAATSTSSSLQNQITSDNQEITQLNQEIATYESQIQKLGSDRATLQEAINALNLQRNTVEAQITLTQKEINSTQIQIEQLGQGISSTQQTINTSQAALAEDIRSIQINDDQPLIVQVFSSENLAQLWSDYDATLQVQGAIQNNVNSLQTQKSELAASQTATEQKQSTLTSQKESLAEQQLSLVQTKQSEAQLLAETDSKQSNYEKLLAQAKAELNGFSAFAASAGGSGLLTDQTSCDAWGCYYNQRDSAWGDDPLDGTKYRLASDGCLITSMAMVMTHYGYTDVTPVTINANPSNFASYYPGYLLYTINVDGVSVSRKTTTIDATLATGNPVIVGLYAYGGTHYVVLVSGSDGNYLMRDPYIPNGKDISFTAHYSLNKIFGISKVVIGS